METFQYSVFHKRVCTLKMCVSLRCLLVFSVERVCLCVSHPVFWQGGQTDRLGCATAISSAWLNVSPSFRLSLSCPPSNYLMAIFTLLQQGEGVFFLHLPYLATCTGGLSPLAVP